MCIRLHDLFYNLRNLCLSWASYRRVVVYEKLDNNFFDIHLTKTFENSVRFYDINIVEFLSPFNQKYSLQLMYNLRTWLITHHNHSNEGLNKCFLTLNGGYID